MNIRGMTYQVLFMYRDETIGDYLILLLYNVHHNVVGTCFCAAAIHFDLGVVFVEFV